MRLTLLFALTLGLSACASLDRYPIHHGYAPPPLVAAALDEAGDNASELEATLEHYAALEDPEKLAAAEFLIANMEGQGYSKIELVDTDGNVVPYQALDHKNYDGARAELDRLDSEHGGVDFKGTEFISDLDVITSEFLIHSIDEAFTTWRTNPWSKSVDFDTFCETILPYRGSNEPLEAWRPLVIERLAPIADELGDETDTKTAAARVNREVGRWLGFDPIFYIHPTDMGYDEMVERGQGRCEDITNMNTYAMRAGGLPSAADYTPYWADRDNNHAWPVVLDEHGEGHAPLSARAAKIYRKTFALQRDGLAFELGEGETAPKWLDRKHYVDVTAQYVGVSAFDIDFAVPPPATSRHAYLAVFNAGGWHAIAWARLNTDQQRAHFEDIGRDIVYLPSYFDDGLVPGAAPFFLHKDGARTTYAGTAAPTPVALIATTRGKLTQNEDGTPASRLEPDATYTLSIWKDGDWHELGKQTPKGTTAIQAKLPADGLFWMVKEGSRKLERPFAIMDGMQVFM
jgi:hypothetical protein